MAAFVSILPGTFPGAARVSLSNASFQTSITVFGGGIDPVAVPAAVGDTIIVAIETPGSSEPERFGALVRAVRRPRVIRTQPSPDRTDLPLNARILIVFTEPIDRRTVDSTSVFLQAGGTRVKATLTISSDGLLGELASVDSLAPATTYRLQVTQAVTDLAGSTLEEPLDVSFTTVAGPPPPFMSGAFTLGLQHTCAVKAAGEWDAGTLYCWGSNDRWQLGTSDFRRTYIPTSANERGDLFFTAAGGDWMTCGLLSTTHEAACGGAVVDSRDDPRQFTTWFAPVAHRLEGSPAFTALAAGGRHHCGLTPQRSLLCWGNNEAGQLGNGAVSAVSRFIDTLPNRTLVLHIVPELVVGARAYQSVTAGAAHTCAQTTAGELFCWGEHRDGQLGVAAPASCALVGCGPVGQGAYATITAGARHTCALDASGGAWCWGSNTAGQLGNTTATIAYVPVPVAHGPLIRIAAGGNHTCGLDATGAAWCWGSDEFGQLGIGSTGGSHVPTAVGGGLAFVEIAAGGNHTCARTAAGELYCWGDNQWGQVGVPELGAQALPRRVAYYP